MLSKVRSNGDYQMETRPLFFENFHSTVKHKRIRIIRHAVISAESHGQTSIDRVKFINGKLFFNHFLLHNVHRPQRIGNLCHLFLLANDRLDGVAETIELANTYFSFFLLVHICSCLDIRLGNILLSRVDLATSEGRTYPIIGNIDVCGIVASRARGSTFLGLGQRHATVSR